MKLSVLMPVYNERATFKEILRRVQEVPIDKEIIIVDNCSTDGTREELQALLDANKAENADGRGNLRIVLQAQNKGKGSSVRRALELARGDWVIVQDADLEYDPQDYLKLLEVAERSPNRHAVFGSRLKRGTASLKGMPHTSFYYGRIGLSILFRILYASPLSDVATCYKLMRRELAQSLALKGSGFELDFEIPARLRRRGVRIYEVPVSYAPRTELEGKKIRAAQDGLHAAWTLLKYRFTR